MNIQEIENKVNAQHYIEPEMFESAFDFWFSSNEHIRSPFPDYIREELRWTAIDKFIDWSNKISEDAKKEINDEILAEKFEEILFEIGLNLVLTEDEKLTIRYPFMIRIGDKIKQKEVDSNERDSTVNDRWLEKDGDIALMRVKLTNDSTQEIWETMFELPE